MFHEKDTWNFRFDSDGAGREVAEDVWACAWWVGQLGLVGLVYVDWAFAEGLDPELLGKDFFFVFFAKSPGPDAR